MFAVGAPNLRVIHQTAVLGACRFRTVIYSIVLTKDDISGSIKLDICQFVMESLDQESAVLQWHDASSRFSEPPYFLEPDWDKHKKCFAVAIFVVSRHFIGNVNIFHAKLNIKPPHTISLTPFGMIREDSLSLPAEARDLLQLLMAPLRNTHGAYGILSDEISSVVVDQRYGNINASRMALSRVLSKNIPVRVVLAWCIHSEAKAWDFCILYRLPQVRLYRGALDDPNKGSYTQDIDQLVASKKWFSDFDIYTMQRVPKAWSQFCAWHRHINQAAITHPVSPGTKFLIGPHEFSSRHMLHRSPYPFTELPQDTVDSVMHDRRPRNDSVHNILSTQTSPTFTVLEIKSGGPEHWSQVFYGHIEGCEEVLCLKVFDERYFNIFSEDDIGFGGGPSPNRRLLYLNPSEDLVRREETVYHRLQDYQGTLLPHCYGFHLVCDLASFRLC